MKEIEGSPYDAIERKIRTKLLKIVDAHGWNYFLNALTAMTIIAEHAAAKASMPSEAALWRVRRARVRDIP